MSARISWWLGLVAGAVLTVGCGKDDGFTREDGQALFEGREIKFQSTYVYFPSDFSLSIVRDTMPQDEVCAILKRYSSSTPKLPGLPVLPYKEEHYALVVTVDSVQPGDDVSFDPTDTGTSGDMRYAALAHYGVGKNRDADWAMRICSRWRTAWRAWNKTLSTRHLSRQEACFLSFVSMSARCCVAVWAASRAASRVGR